MAKEAIKIQEGNVLAYTNTGSADIAVGEVIPLNTRCGIALENIPVGATSSVALTGVWQVPAETGVAWTFGVALYWDDINGRATTTSTGNTPLGYAWKAKDSADAIGYVKLLG